MCVGLRLWPAAPVAACETLPRTCAEPCHGGYVHRCWLPGDGVLYCGVCRDLRLLPPAGRICVWRRICGGRHRHLWWQVEKATEAGLRLLPVLVWRGSSQGGCLQPFPPSKSRPPLRAHALFCSSHPKRAPVAACVVALPTKISAQQPPRGKRNSRCAQLCCVSAHSAGAPISL